MGHFARIRLLTEAAAVLLLALLLAGCGTESAKTTPAASGSASPSLATVGDTLTVRGTDRSLAVTLVSTMRMPSYRLDSLRQPALFGAKLTVKNLGTTVYQDSIILCTTLVDGKDQTLHPEVAVFAKNGGPPPTMLANVNISPGDKRSGWVFFVLPIKQKPRLLQFCGNGGGGPEVGEWVLR